MYREFYALREKPFALVPDTRYLYLSDSHREALAHVLYGVREGEGFIAVVGQVGTGKTTLCRALLDRIEKEVDVGFIFNPSSSQNELLAAINREFGIPAQGPTRSELIEELNRFLLERRQAGRRVLLVIDEAQNLTPTVLEQVRLLSNLETERGKLLQILLLGQPELDVILSGPELRQLRQRISVRWELAPLSPDETEEYVEHRLRVAGARDREIFTPGAAWAIYRVTRGVPRLINAVADRALLAGYSEGMHRIDARTVWSVARELPGAHVARPRRIPRSGLRAAAVLLVGVVAGLLLESWLWQAGDDPTLVPSAAPPVRVEESALVAEPVGVSEIAEPPPVSPWEEAVQDPELARWLESQTPSSTGAIALDAVLDAWGYDPPGYRELLPEQFAPALEEGTSLEVLDASSGVDQLERLNLPAVLELEPLPGEIRYVALVRGEPGADLLLEADDRVFSVARERVKALWTGRALFLWTNFEAIPELRLSMTGKPVQWLQRNLIELGYLPRTSASGVFDADTRSAVRRLQTDHRLDPSGEVGPATLIAIYHRLRYGVPLLFVDVDAS